MSLSSFLGRLVEVFDAAGVPFMLSGSLASAFYGTPRSTQDIVVVVVLTLQSLRGLLRRFPDTAYYVSASAARDALRRRGQFNVIERWAHELGVLDEWSRVLAQRGEV